MDALRNAGSHPARGASCPGPNPHHRLRSHWRHRSTNKSRRHNDRAGTRWQFIRHKPIWGPEHVSNAVQGYTRRSADPGVQPRRNSLWTTLGTDGDLYSSNYNGGSNGFGDLFKVTPSGTPTLLYTFLFNSGPANPPAPPIEAADGIYYGTTPDIQERSGYFPESVAYSLTSAGVFTVVHTFTGTDGQNVYAGLVQGTDGNFFGCSAAGGTNSDGVIFKMTAA